MTPVEQLPTPPEIRALAEELAPGRWPTADVAGLRESAARCRDVAARLATVADTIVDAHRAHEISGGAGAFHDGIVDAGVRLASADADLGRTIDSLVAAATAAEAYADASVETHNEMTVIASIADRERLRADLLTTLGDDSAQVVAAGAGRMALTAAGDDYTDRAGDAGRRDHDDPQPTPAATSGMMPFSALGGLAAAGAGMIAGSRGAGSAAADDALDEADADWLRRRAEQLQASLPSAVAGFVRMAVGIGRSADGSRAVVIGTSDPHPYQRAGLELGPGEVLAGNGRAAEFAVLDHMAHVGAEPRAIAAATPMAPDTVAALGATDAEVFAPTDADPVGPAWLHADTGDDTA